jgi:hypothetical protein
MEILGGKTDATPTTTRLTIATLNRMVTKIWIIAAKATTMCWRTDGLSIPKRVSENSSDHHIVVLLQKGGVVVPRAGRDGVHLVSVKVNAISLRTIIILHAFDRPVHP